MNLFRGNIWLKSVVLDIINEVNIRRIARTKMNI